MVIFRGTAGYKHAEVQATVNNPLSPSWWFINSLMFKWSLLMTLTQSLQQKEKKESSLKDYFNFKAWLLLKISLWSCLCLVLGSWRNFQVRGI